MPILIGLVLALAALYWWLIGHWFARVVMLFPIALVLGVIGIWVGGSIPQKEPSAAEPKVYSVDAGLFDAPAVTVNPFDRFDVAPAVVRPAYYPEMLGGLMGLVAAWFVSGIPIYYHRRRMLPAARLF